MKYRMRMTAFFLAALFSVLLSIWGPEALAKYQDKGMLDEIHEEPTVFEREYVVEEMESKEEPFTVSFDEKEQVYVVEGPRIEKMLGYTNLDSEKGFQFFQKFMHTNGIIEELEALGIEEGDTVKMYELQFDYYK